MKKSINSCLQFWLIIKIMFLKIQLQLFRTIANLKSSDHGMKGKPQKNTIKSSISSKPLRRQHKKRNDLDDCMLPTSKRQCIKKYITRFNNNYEKQQDCFEENVVLDNKLYISLASRNSSFSSSYSGCSSMNKHRRVIYPTSGGRFKVNGFLRHIDFNYESPVNETPSENLNSSEEVVFEKVKMNKGAGSSSVDSVNICAFNDPVNICSDDDDQWENFLKLRNQPKNGEHSKTLPVDSMFQMEKIDNTLNEDLEDYRRQVKIFH